MNYLVVLAAGVVIGALGGAFSYLMVLGFGIAIGVIGAEIWRAALDAKKIYRNIVYQHDIEIDRAERARLDREERVSAGLGA